MSAPVQGLNRVNNRKPVVPNTGAVAAADGDANDNTPLPEAAGAVAAAEGGARPNAAAEGARPNAAAEGGAGQPNDKTPLPESDRVPAGAVAAAEGGARPNAAAEGGAGPPNDNTPLPESGTSSSVQFEDNAMIYIKRKDAQTAIISKFYCGMIELNDSKNLHKNLPQVLSLTNNNNTNRAIGIGIAICINENTGNNGTHILGGALVVDVESESVISKVTSIKSIDPNALQFQEGSADDEPNGHDADKVITMNYTFSHLTILTGWYSFKTVNNACAIPSIQLIEKLAAVSTLLGAPNSKRNKFYNQ